MIVKPRGRAVPAAQPNRRAEWGPWEWRNHLIGHELAPDSFKRACLNTVYAVMFFEADTAWGMVDHLMIKRHDAQPVRNWYDLQIIKNELLGAERVAVEVYPPQSELVDDANIYHLWVLPAGFVLPFGLGRA